MRCTDSLHTTFTWMAEQNTDTWPNKDIADTELALTGCVMFRKDRREKRGGGVILYSKKSIKAYEITLKTEADCEEV